MTECFLLASSSSPPSCVMEEEQENLKCWPRLSTLLPLSGPCLFPREGGGMDVGGAECHEDDKPSGRPPMCALTSILSSPHHSQLAPSVSPPVAYEQKQKKKHHLNDNQKIWLLHTYAHTHRSATDSGATPIQNKSTAHLSIY